MCQPVSSIRSMAETARGVVERNSLVTSFVRELSNNSTKIKRGDLPMTNALKIMTAEALSFVLGNNAERMVLVQPGSGTMINMNVVIEGEVKLHGFCIPANEISGKLEEGSVYRVDSEGLLSLVVKDTVKIPAKTVGCTMEQMRRNMAPAHAHAKR